MVDTQTAPAPSAADTANDRNTAGPSTATPPGPKKTAPAGLGAGLGSGLSRKASPILPARPVAAPPAQPSRPNTGPILDPDEPEDIQQVRKRIHAVRVSLIRAAHRLNYKADNGLVRQVLYRLSLAEKLKAPWRRSTRRPDPNEAASDEAERLEAATSTSSSSSTNAGDSKVQPLGFCVRMMLVGLAGSGKTQLIHALLGDSIQPSNKRLRKTLSPPTTKANNSKQQGQDSTSTGATNSHQADSSSWVAVDPISGATKNNCIYRGHSCGIPLEILDTPGLLAAAGGTSHNAGVLQQIKRGYKSFKPDLVVYVDRLDAGGAARWGGELPALRGLSSALGPATWLNTIVALTHAGSPPPIGGRGQVMPWDQWVNQRSHALQQVIRAASGDNRLMNPTAFVESHPGAAGAGTGSSLMYNGMAWKPHFLLMVVSAKLLADTENMLQMQDGGEGGKAAGGPNSADTQHILNQMMMGAAPRTLPLPYLVTQATQFSQPLHYPDHDQVMAVRQTEAAAASTYDPRQRKLLVRQAKAMRLQIKQGVQYKEKMARSFRMATLAGSKVTPEPPKLATKRPPSAHPPATYRYRVPEPAGGWVVRPTIEPHAEAPQKRQQLNNASQGGQ